MAKHEVSPSSEAIKRQEEANKADLIGHFMVEQCLKNHEIQSQLEALGQGLVQFLLKNGGAV